MIWVFWISVGLIAYTYVIYPILLLFLAGLKQLSRDLRFGLARRNRRRSRATERPCPQVSIVFAAHNEERVIREKLRNCGEVEYPSDNIEIIVGCDACSDRTVELARSSGVRNVSVHDFRTRSGKAGVLNRLVPLAQGEVIIFSDANTLFDPGAVAAVVRHFEDPNVGCVSGELRLRAANGKPNCEGLYWRYEMLLKFLESRLNMLVGGNGAVLAVRRSLFRPIPSKGIIDDFLVAMDVRGRGHRVVYDPEAVGWEDAAPTVRDEFQRRIRIGTGNFHALQYTWKLLSPSAGSISFSYWSHKITRWVVPIALCSGFLSAVALSLQPQYAACVLGALAFVTLGYRGYLLDLRGKYSRLSSIPYYFLSMNLALLIGLCRFLFGRQSLVWNPTRREPPSAGGSPQRGAGVADAPPEQLQAKGANV